MMKPALLILPLGQTILFYSLQTLRDAPFASFVSFIPFLIIGGLIAYLSWPQGEGRISRLIQDLVLSFGVGFFLFLIINAFLFLVVALGADSEGGFAKFIHIISIFTFWAIAILFFNSQKNKAQYLGMNWVELEHDDSEPPKEFVTFDELRGALNLLGLEPDVTMEELKKRYRELSLLYHPDRLSGMSSQAKDSAQKEFKRIKNAYEIVEEALRTNKL